MKTIILTNKSTEAIRLHQRLIQLDKDFNQVQCLTPESLTDSNDIKECEIIFSTWYMPKLSKDKIKRFFPNLKAVFYAAGTVRYFAVPFLESGVRVFSAAKANGVPVAEFAAAQIILANKGCFISQKKYRWPIWRRGFKKIRTASEMHAGNYHSLIGLLGCGAVGSMVATLLKPYALRIKVYDPYLSDIKAKELGVEKTSLEDIFSSCNVISNHMPDIEETKGIINKGLLQTMVPYATIINTGRGAQINEKDLVTVLKKRKDLCALLDVTCHEPPFPWSGLYFRKNIILTPHIAGSQSSEIDRMIDFIHQSYRDYSENRSSLGEVTLEDLIHKA